MRLLLSFGVFARVSRAVRHDAARVPPVVPARAEPGLSTGGAPSFRQRSAGAGPSGVAAGKKAQVQKRKVAVRFGQVRSLNKSIMPGCHCASAQTDEPADERKNATDRNAPTRATRGISRSAN